MEDSTQELTSRSKEAVLLLFSQECYVSAKENSRGSVVREVELSHQELDDVPQGLEMPGLSLTVACIQFRGRCWASIRSLLPKQRFPTDLS